jgi:hypothetical protein
MDQTLTSDEIAGIATDAYVYFFPMLMGYRYAYATFLAPASPTYRGAPNEMHGEPATLDHRFRDVITPNADTPYSMALLDLRAEPAVIEVPAVSDRYYVLQFEDLYGANVHYVGSRATGTGPGTYLAVGPHWEGEVPDDITKVLPFETDLVFIIGRTQVFGPHDIGALNTVMNAYGIQPLSAFLGVEPIEPPEVAWPAWNDPASRDERFIGYVNPLLGFCQPPHPTEIDLMSRFAQIGIGPGFPFDAGNLDDPIRAALKAGVDAAREAISAKVGDLGERVNGWNATTALGSREFFNGDYLLRAAGAMAGWGGNDMVEAYYPLTHEDSEGRPLDGAHRYRLTFQAPPPTRAFWSVTMYDTSYDGVAGFLVDNPIDRYLINSITQGLIAGDDGSLTIFIQHAEPDSDEGKANWLPSPEGRFYLAMRLYWPTEVAFDGSWAPPPVVRI